MTTILTSLFSTLTADTYSLNNSLTHADRTAAYTAMAVGVASLGTDLPTGQKITLMTLPPVCCFLAAVLRETISKQHR